VTFAIYSPIIREAQTEGFLSHSFAATARWMERKGTPVAEAISRHVLPSSRSRSTSGTSTVRVGPPRRAH
jgi:hypothetical protein